MRLRVRGRYKFVLDKAAVLGKDIKSASATQSTTSSVDWQTNLNFNSAGGAAFGKVTEQMFSKYGVNSVQDELAVVLDGNVISFPVIAGRDPRRVGADHRQLQPGRRPPTWPTC